jgi:hypothetical protein
MDGAFSHGFSKTGGLYPTDFDLFLYPGDDFIQGFA